MESKFFGSIDENIFETLDKNQQEKYLFERKLLNQVFSSSKLKETDKLGIFTVKIPISEDNLKYNFTKELAKTVYNFLLKHYEAGIGGDLALFNRDFDEKTFGLSPKKKEK